jgi:hypothetical protein
MGTTLATTSGPRVQELLDASAASTPISSSSSSCPRNVACPVCKEQRFKSGANAVQHVESGYCTGCLGVDNARNQIYQFASSKPQMQHYLTSVPMLTNGSNTNYVPDLPYNCPDCSKSFRALSQLLQHQDQKHNNHRLLRY